MNKTDVEFLITICDGFDKYGYRIVLSDQESIHSVYQKLCKAYGIEPTEEGTFISGLDPNE